MGKSKHKKKDDEQEYEFDFEDIVGSYHSYEGTMDLGGLDSKKSKSNHDFTDAGYDDQSTVGGKSKKKKKKSKSTSAIGTDDDKSTMSRKKKSKKKIKRKGDDDDNASVGSFKSTRSTRSTKSSKSRKSTRSVRKPKSKPEVLKRDVEASFHDTRRVKELEIENAALLDETAAVRKQLVEAEHALKKASAGQGLQQENLDLQHQLEEYEDAVIEKDELIQKLTGAVETQVDKVEELQVKLVGAEDELMQMEEEIKQMEIVIEDLRDRPPSQVDITNDNSGRSSNAFDKTLDEEILEQLDERKRELERREQDLLIKEDIMLARQTLIKEQEDELAMKRGTLLRANDAAKNDMSHQNYELQAKIAELEAKNNNLEYQIRQSGTGTETYNGKNTTSAIQHEEELRSLRNEYEQKIADTKLEKEILQKEFDGFKGRKNAENDELRRQVKTVKMEKQHVEASSRQMQRMVSVRMESMRSMDPESTKNIIVEQDEEDFSLQVEVEIAELREKIVDQENQSLRLKRQIDVHLTVIDELRQALEERDIEMKNIGNQIRANQEAAAKKMKQKDETITFMQRTMMQINQEKQEMQKVLRDNKIDLTQIKLNARFESDEVEKAKNETINSELRKLDEENRKLEETLNQVKYDTSLRMKERESAFLELQEELNNVKWELGAREKGADYITLLKDRKERKIQLANAKRDLKEAEEKISDLERQMEEFDSVKKGLEDEIETMNDSDSKAKQISGLKRQIKSLKDHNTTLERKLENQTRDTEDTLVEKEAKIQILQYELHKIRNEPPQPVGVGGVMAAFNNFGFGRENGEAQSSATGMDGIGNPENSTNNNGKAGNRWGLFGQRKETPKTGSSELNMPNGNGFAEIATL